MGKFKNIIGTKAISSPKSPSSQEEQEQPSYNSLVEPSPKKNKIHKRIKTVRVFSSIVHSFPIVNPKTCRLPEFKFRNNDTGKRVTGTLFGYKKGKISFALQQTSRSLPTLVLELPIQTHVLQKEMRAGMVRISLECQKRVEKEKKTLLEEQVWDTFCDGKKYGYAVAREANKMDLKIMELLKVISIGVGILPSVEFPDGDDPEDELTYTRANFDHVVGSKDSETLYMLCPEGNNNVLDLSIFFVRI